jgi:hypothetical protein
MQLSLYATNAHPYEPYTYFSDSSHSRFSCLHLSSLPDLLLF